MSLSICQKAHRREARSGAKLRSVLWWGDGNPINPAKCFPLRLRSRREGRVDLDELKQYPIHSQ